jgi:PEGA domain
MKRLIYILLLSLMAAGTYAQSAADSVKVRLETSAGAEIGIDEDMSSTNIMSKLVARGKHVVKVTYGSDFERTFDIEVTREETFKFSIDGKITINSTPTGKKVYVDGIERGRTPLTLDIIGDHNLTVEGDAITYFDATDHVSVNPFENVERSYTFAKRPPRTYGMVMATYSGGGAGLFLGICKRWGGYIRFGTSFSALGADYILDDVKNASLNVYHKDDSHTTYMMGAGGVIARCHKYVYAYLGGGYGQYLKCFEKENRYGFYPISIAPYGSQGGLLDVGVILKWKALLISGGYTQFLGGDPKPYHEFNVGIGFTIHKNKKNRR